MRTLILLLLEIQVVAEHLIRFRLAQRREGDGHVELAPAPLADGEGRLLDDLPGALAERLVQQVGGFFEACRGQVLAFRADEVDGDGP